MSKLRPVSIEAYKCPKCDSVIKGPYKQAQKHVDVPIDRHLPVGFVYTMSSNIVYIVAGKGEKALNHGHLQPVIAHSLNIDSILLNDYRHINSKKIRESFRKKKAYFLALSIFKYVKSKYNGIKSADGKPLNLKRTTSSLEKLANSK